MEFLTGLGGGFLSILFYVAAFLVALTVIVFVHEFGHFQTGRFFRVRVETFSIGFGRAMTSWTDSKGTLWKVGWLPLGGYVKFWGDEGAASTPDRARIAHIKTADDSSACFHLKPIWQRAIIVAAGPVANFILAIVIYAALLSTVGEARLEPRIAEVIEGTPAAEAGFQPGDLIRAIDGNPIDDFIELRRYVVLRDGDEMRFDVERDGKTISLVAAPRRAELTDGMGNKMQGGQLGIRPVVDDSAITYVRCDPFTALWEGTVTTYRFSVDTLTYLGRMIVGKGDVSQLSGPAGIAKAAGDAAAVGPLFFINLIAVLSISIGLINLFPIPMLDGGHLVYYAIEGVRGEPLGERAQEIGFRMGLAFVLCLMIFATLNDLGKFGLF